jgi:Beta-lactamase enzyme family
MSRWICARLRVLTPAGLVVLSLTVAAVNSAAADTPPAPAQSIERLFRAESFDQGWFAPELLSKASADTLRRAVRQLVDNNGAFEGVARRGEEYLVELERALVPTVVGFDAEGRMTTLFFKRPIPRFGNVDDAKSAFTALPGKVALLVMQGNHSLMAFNDDQPLAVGSAFKLSVLAGVVDTVADGKLAWTDAKTLQDNWRALPTGILQDWPADSVLTVQTLSELMISLSDNTAADALMSLIGRERVEAIAPHNVPFLTAREYFILRAYPNQELRKEYLAAPEPKRRALLTTVDALPLPSPAAFSSGVIPDIEWYFSTREVCGLIERVHGLPAFRINPGLAIPAEWRETAFKGGGDKGVLNLTTRVETQDGRSYCAAATWNDEKLLDDERMMTAYTALLDWLSRQR